MSPRSSLSFTVPVTTSLPIIPGNTDRKHIHTARLVLRPLRQSDLASFHHLRSQPEVMKWTALGIVDSCPEVTQQTLDLFMPPQDLSTYNFAICLRTTTTTTTTTRDQDENPMTGSDRSCEREDESGDFIGVGGCHLFGMFDLDSTPTCLGWPELGYMIRKDYWGQGYASEFLHAFMAAWKALPRKSFERVVDKSTVFPLPPGSGEDKTVGSNMGEKVGERLVAITESTNFVSIRLLEKNGFVRGEEWQAKNTHVGATTEYVTLIAWLWDPSAPPYIEV